MEALDFAAESTDKEPTLQPPRPDGDDGEVLVVQTPGAQIGQRGDELLVSVKGEEVRKLPGQQVRAIYCYGAVQMTAQAVSTCLELGIDVSYFSPAGRFLGMLGGLPASGVDARRGQYRLFELPGVRLQLAREVIRAKIHNQRVMLMRNGDVPDRVMSLMASFRDATESARDLTALLGIEGSAAALYFEQFESMLKQRDDWKFDWRGRNRRPPRDPVNALLSLGYSMLAKELTGVCHSVGLDPFLGFMHQPRYGRPALALDLMEEFRPLVADSVAISLINRGELGPEDFIRSANGTFLNGQRTPAVLGGVVSAAGHGSEPPGIQLQNGVSPDAGSAGAAVVAVRARRGVDLPRIRNQVTIAIAAAMSAYLVSYDISDPKRLRKVARSLEGFGVRLQYSVFECPLDDLRLAKLKAELQDLFNHDEDQVLFVSLGRQFQRRELDH